MTSVPSSLAQARRSNELGDVLARGGSGIGGFESASGRVEPSISPLSVEIDRTASDHQPVEGPPAVSAATHETRQSLAKLLPV